MDDESAAKLLAYIDALLEDPDHAELDASELPGNLRQLGERLSYLGACVQEGRVFAEDLARGNLEAISSQYTNRANPLIPNLEDVRKSLAQFLSLGTSFVEADKAAQFEGQGEYIAMLNRMIGEVQRRHTELEHSANTDPLTGVGNRRLYERTMEALWEKGEPFTVAFIDIDQLKRCNDHFGHEGGQPLHPADEPHAQAAPQAGRGALSHRRRRVRLRVRDGLRARACQAARAVPRAAHRAVAPGGAHGLLVQLRVLAR